MALESTSDFKKKYAPVYKNLYRILKTMSQPSESGEIPRRFTVTEISVLSSLQDEKETLRHLFILEGQKLVSPYPKTDLTSKQWNITSAGFEALELMGRSL